ncbi:protein spaetzle 4 [Culicoides brevitarsis]|uniref:protein spaetzle 4 n=1 Tax=Culicoides brevitarsis TaxID=469753 RepID=UPI00307BF671
MDYKKLAQIFFGFTFTISLVTHISYAYGYDSGGACDPRASRKGRAQLIASIPCDLSTQSYCNLPGSAYPWHAVRRFVHENQGLMKRMYGDIRQISVLKNEFDGNYLESDDFEAVSERYSKKNYRAMKFTPERNAGLKKNNRKSDTIMEPHFRLQSTSTTTTKQTTTSTTKSTTTTTPKPTTSANPTVTTKKPNYSNSKDYYLLTNNDTAPIDFEVETNKLNVGSNNETLLSFSEQDAVTVVTLSSSQASQEQLMASNETESTTKRHSTTTEEAISGSESSEDSYETGEELEVSEEDDEEEDVAPTMKGQLFQDTVQKPVPNPPMNVRGVNACPVKEEVVAPFWANNTRGETLALLNLYPFEQYVHWEKCTNEHKQMFCRDGCRCEQQFSLHRLLAYDPHNECRGIFSDWFKFPSCCVCKCYDIPFDYRVTSRSPRSIQPEKSPLEEAQATVHQAMYEHSVDEFYRPKDFNIYEEEDEEN